MNFNSSEFFVFLGVVLPLTWLLRRARYQNVVLLVTSYVFYAWWDWRFVGLILFSTFANYFLAHGIERNPEKRTKKRLLFVCIVVNLGILGFFKYFNFGVETIQLALAQIGVNPEWARLDIVLPVGISFYTFQTMGYTIDVYRQRLRATRDPLLFALYVAYFPQLVAGPIERATNLLPRLASRKIINADGLAQGAWLILLGLFQKVVLADNMARIVESVFSGETTSPSGLTALAVLAFTFQIYGDFAGYSNVARGCSRLLGVELMQNFRRPYFARDPREFWTRWHISLSTWLRDFLYVPLGGNRRGPVRTLVNLMVTMILGGLWHGATWMFVAWGTFHGVVLVGHRLWTRVRPRWLDVGPWRLPYGLLSWAVMFVVVAFGWLLFRADSVSQAAGIVSTLAGPWQWTHHCTTTLCSMAIFCGPLFLVEILSERKDRDLTTDDGLVLRSYSPRLRGALAAMMLYQLAATGAPTGPDFIYFQF
jgi:D-alanyl-lipoteichoic acid acyltransferase DltB (MBOAT superfamily)